MKVALITDGIFPYVLGGMQKHSYFVAKYLAKNGVYVDIYHTWAIKEHDINKLEYFTEEEKKYIGSYVIDFPVTGKIPGHYLRESYEYSRRVYEVFNKNRGGIDFIYIKGFAGWKLIEEKTKGVAFPPIGIKFHGLNMFQRLPNLRAKLEAWMFRPPVMYNLKNSDYVFSYGGKITDITKSIGVPVHKIIEIPTGIDEGWLHAPKENSDDTIRRFVFIGRYERLKGVEELTVAIKGLLKENNFEFHFIGPIPEKVKVKHDKVIYHATITDIEKIRALLDSMDCLVCPSYSEGMPNAIIEAMSRGAAIIATDVGAINCLVNEKNGFLLSECSVEEIEAAMRKIINLSWPDLYKMKWSSYAFTKTNLIWDKIGERLVKEISSRINGNHP
jgi:glycosyltransferase involved in cell wall biosynthesis